MATIKALEGQTVHQIQSGQVVVDLCSVVKELVENSLDAGATSIEVRFKNNGLDSIEVQDNGIGISSDNYETVALKHYTSKLSDYDDLATLQTFGFRGEALSSLCALSVLHIVTAQADQAPKGTRLDFEISGKLKTTSVIASQKGTTVTVEDLFRSLPVRRRELEKNIKREYGKVLNLLQAYACISTEARISASNLMAKGKKAIVFATKPNSTTRENIANVFGTKALPMLVSLDLHFDLLPTSTLNSDTENKHVQIMGHVSRPVFGEGRNAPDRQMFFVNGRPCSLPQVARVFNEVYKSYNVSQSPFVFANIILDTNAYDVNVSPDKRTIMLHDQSNLLESMRTSLTELFEKQDQTVPQSQKTVSRMLLSTQLSLGRGTSKSDSTELSRPDSLQHTVDSNNGDEEENRQSEGSAILSPDSRSSKTALPNLIADFAGRNTRERKISQIVESSDRNGSSGLSREKQKVAEKVKEYNRHRVENPDDHTISHSPRLHDEEVDSTPEPALDGHRQLDQEPVKTNQDNIELSVPPLQSDHDERRPENTPTPSPHKASIGIVPNAFERMRARRQSPEVATITIGSKTASTVLGGSIFKKQRIHPHSLPVLSTTPSEEEDSSDSDEEVSRQLQAFAAPGTGKMKASDSTERRSPITRLQRDETEENEEELRSEVEVEDDGDESSLAEKDESDHQREQSLQDTELDEEYVDEETKRVAENAKVAELIREAEKAQSIPDIDKKRRAQQILRGAGTKDSSTELIQMIDTSVQRISLQINRLRSVSRTTIKNVASQSPPADPEDFVPLEDRLTLKISKDQFASMQIIGQFNLGFILATRADTDLFIIDQHASDEKYNFERLQSTTIVQNQLLVHPRKLELTAVDEEIILENNDALLKNGFLVEIDQSGSEPVGQRCKLLTLPMSKEVTFDTSDMEELIALLADSPSLITTTTSANHHYIPRPSKVRRMFAMRACRSSIMIGKTLSMRQMQTLLRHMGEIDKPWNCPHGRPTMRHLCGLGDWRGWMEGDGVGGVEEEEEDVNPIDWRGWAERVTASSSSDEGGSADVDDGDGTDVRNADVGGGALESSGAEEEGEKEGETFNSDDEDNG